MFFLALRLVLKHFGYIINISFTKKLLLSLCLYSYINLLVFKCTTISKNLILIKRSDTISTSDQKKLSVIQVSHQLTTISIEPLEILVGMLKAWKKEVFSGPRPVFCGGMMTSLGAIALARAGAATLLERIKSRISTRSSSVKTIPTFPLMCGRSLFEKSLSAFEKN